MSDPVLDPIQRRLPDGGPVYVETPPDIEKFTGTVAEPWNTVSACLFVLIVLLWIWRLRGRYRDHVFLTACLPLLLAGGIGGVLFHGRRTSFAFFLLDVIPIYLLGLSVMIWIWVRLGPRWHHLIGFVAVLGFLQMFAQLRLPRQWAINVSYASLALMVLLPVVLALVRTRFFQGGWVVTALICFALAWVCRIADTTRPPLLTMGTHWLWHLFGAATTAALSVYVYHIEQVSLRSASTGSGHVG